jgi:hypothetical protein
MSSIENSFYITLPSNTKQFHLNKLNSYRVRLPHRLLLDGPGWEVALVEAIYPHSWFNFNAEENDGAEIMITISVAYENDAKKTVRFSNVMPIHIPSDYYQNASQLVDAINDEISLKTEKEYERYVKYASENKIKLLLDSVPLFLSFDYNTRLNRVLLHIEEGDLVQKVRLSPMLAYMLGFGRANITVADKGWELLSNGEITRKADYPPDMNAGLYAIYIYCDIVENQIVGNALVPLLAKVPVTGAHDSIVHTVFSQPMYLPLLRQEIETVEVEIKDDTNKLIEFQYGKVLLTLHFRRRLTFI